MRTVFLEAMKNVTGYFKPLTLKNFHVYDFNSFLTYYSRFREHFTVNIIFTFKKYICQLLIIIRKCSIICLLVIELKEKVFAVNFELNVGNYLALLEVFSH
jgi:hypothetical protein